MKKRILSILLTLCMVICLVPITVFAATQTVGSWSGLQNLMNSTNNLSVALSSDISWGGSPLTVPAGKTVTLDLNGKAIDAKSNGTVIVVNGTLTIKNSGADLAGPIGVGAGPITGNIKNGKAGNQEAGGILVASGGKLIMNSGWLTNCVDGSGKISAAGGIYVSENAAFEMTGGIITGCIGSDLLCAAGVVNYGTFTMSGNATISGSKTKYNSDGVAICNAGTLNANGGTVQTGQSVTNYATIQNTGKSAAAFYCNVLNTGLGTIKGGSYNYPVENAGTITGGTFDGKVTSNGTINDGTFNGTVDNTRVVTGGTFNGTTSGIYTVTFDSGAPSQIRANYPATAPDAPTKRGYTFNGWLNGGTPYDFTQNVTQNLSLTADWAAKRYTVKFDTNGGTTIADKTLCWDDKVLDGVSNPTKPGYDFMGWTFGGGNILARTTYANLADNDTVTSITLTAQWTLHRYTVTFDANGGTVAQDTMTVTYGEELDQMPIPRYKGYFFDGWFDRKWGGRQYSDKYGHSTTRYDKTEDCTLYAMWEEAPLCTVTFDPNGGTLTGAATCEEKQNECIRRPDEEPVREGYNFLGWYKDADCTQRWDFDDPIPGNMTLYAGWQILSYTIRIKPANGEQDIIINENYGTAITPPTLTREGYTFIGWDTPFPEKMPAKIMTITAQWQINQYTITFDTDGGSKIAPITQDYNTAITAPVNPTKEGYTFIGWDNEVPETMPAKNVTITAQWKINQYTITFDTDGGSKVGSKTLSWNDKVLEGVVGPIRNGYNFAGWKYNDNIVSRDTVYADLAVDDSEMSITLTAEWNERSDYTVKFNSDGGTDIADKTNVKWTDKVLEGVEAPLRNTYEFIGWTYNDKLITADTVYADLAADDSVKSITLTAKWRDIEKPTGEIIVSTNRWNKFLNDITFGLFFKETQTVAINATDNSGEQVKVEYLLSGREMTIIELATAPFAEYDGSFDINPDNEYIVYVRLTDTAGNVSYICSEGIVLDGTSPVITGIEKGKIYCEAQTVTIDEKYIDTVTVNGTAVTLDENDSFVLAPADGEQKIVVTDKAGNRTEMTVTVNDGHTYGEWASNSDGTHTRKCAVDGCITGIQTENCSDADKNHKCDNCGATLGECADTDKDHVCDYCGKTISNHEDTDKDHVCDYCGKAISNHEDTDKDHVCDLCGKTISNHEDTDKDHVCDLCGKTISNHEDTDKDHVCDYCGKTISNHEDTDKDHVCDYCGKAISNHEDTDKDHACDLCGKVISNHTGGKATCKDKSVCEVCGKAYGELDEYNHANLKHIETMAATKDAEGNIEYWYCEVCGKYYGDAAAMKEITKADTVTAKLPDDTKSPKTGVNSNLMLWIALMFISGGVLTGVTVFNKRKKHSVK